MVVITAMVVGTHGSLLLLFLFLFLLFQSTMLDPASYELIRGQIANPNRGGPLGCRWPQNEVVL